MNGMQMAPKDFYYPQYDKSRLPLLINGFTKSVNKTLQIVNIIKSPSSHDDVPNVLVSHQRYGLTDMCENSMLMHHCLQNQINWFPWEFRRTDSQGNCSRATANWLPFSRSAIFLSYSTLIVSFKYNLLPPRAHGVYLNFYYDNWRITPRSTGDAERWQATGLGRDALARQLDPQPGEQPRQAAGRVLWRQAGQERARGCHHLRVPQQRPQVRSQQTGFHCWQRKRLASQRPPRCLGLGTSQRPFQVRLSLLYFCSFLRFYYIEKLGSYLFCFDFYVYIVSFKNRV